MPYHTERSSDGTITVLPQKEAEQSALLVFAHGLGDTSEGFANVAEMWAVEFPYMKFILPTAPTQPVTLNMGMSMPSWYDIVGLDERANENCKGLEESVERIRNILKTEHEKNKLPYSRMVLAGFSQGGALSLFTGLGLPEKLGGIVCLSGYLPCVQKFQITPGLHDTPILHCHGKQDMVVHYAMAEKSVQKVREMGVSNYTFKGFSSLGHTVDMDELDHVMRFLRTLLPNDPQYRITLPDPSTLSIKELKAAIRREGLTAYTTGYTEKSEFVRLLQDHRMGKL
jgi:lysophospholipase-2